MNIQELYEICKRAVDQGHGEAPIYFDSCAVCFDAHMVVYPQHISAMERLSLKHLVHIIQI